MRRVLTTTTIYSVAALIGPLVALGLTPLYISAIGVAGYGTVDLIQTVVQLVLPLALWGVPTTLLARTAHRDASAVPAILSSAMRLVVLISIIICTCMIGIAPYVAQTIQRPDSANLIVVYAISLPAAAVYGVVLVMLRLLERVWRTVSLMVTYVIVLAATRIWLVVWWDAGISGMITALAITNGVMAVLAIAMSWRWWWGPTTWADMRACARLGVPLLPASVAVWVLLFIDRWFLAQYVSPLVQGQYALAALLASMMAFVAEPFKHAWQPVARQRTDIRFVAWSLTGYVTVALLLGAVIVTWSPEVLAVIGHADAVAAAPFVPWLLVAPLCSGVVAIVSIPAIRMQRTGTFAWATIGGACVNIGLNVWLIPRYGADGAAWATAIAAVVIPLIHAWRNQVHQPIAYEWWRVMTICAVWVTYVMVVPTVDQTAWVRMLLLSALCGVYAIVVGAGRWHHWRSLMHHADDDDGMSEG